MLPCTSHRLCRPSHMLARPTFQPGLLAHVGVDRAPSRSGPAEPSRPRTSYRAAPGDVKEPSASSSSASKTQEPSATSSTSSTPSPVQPSTSTARTPEEEQLASTWEAAKQSLRGILSQEEAKYIDDLSLEDMTSPDNKAIRKLAQEALGPLLTGTDVDPLQFFLEVVGLATFIQFVTCGMMFYGTEFWGHFDTGEATRAATALVLGYMSRPFLKIETLLGPVYNTFLSTFIPNATYSLPESNSQAAYVSTLNTLGVVLAAAFFAPRLLWGWETEQCLQLVLPLCSGWFLFDVVYMGTLLYKLRQPDQS